MKSNTPAASLSKQVNPAFQKSASIVFLENIELQLLDQLRDAELKWENKCMAQKLLRGPLKNIATRRELEKIAGFLPNEINQDQK